ncbi:MAG: riboflavin synthase [Pseudomonadota bacterium]
MFTGIIQAVGTLQAQQPVGGDLRLQINTGKLDHTDLSPGDSIAVQGVCLTIVELDDNIFYADVSNETLAHTNLGKLTSGSPVNLEKSLTLQSYLSGHWVSGHVDGQGEILGRTDDARSVRFMVRAPETLAHYIAPKGSITLDGVSLTVNQVTDADFGLNIVPQTLRETCFSYYQPGDPVNLEVDILARYLERLLTARSASSPA